MNKIVILSIIGSFLLCSIFIPVIILFCKKFSIYDSVNARKIHSGNIPRLGGIGIAISFIITTSLCFIIDKNLSFYAALPLLLAGFIIFTFGIIDDIVEMKAWLKLMFQLIAGAIVVLNNFRIRQIFGLVLPVPVSLLLTFFWIIGIINAYNLIDGLDGLCGTLSFTTLVTFGIMLLDSYFIGSVVCFCLAASILGFLLFNWPKPNAKIFMGDGGSQFLGFMIATIPLYTSKSEFEFNKFLVMLVVVSFPMMDTIAAIWRRLRDHRKIMSPDKAHLHHKLLNLGFNKNHALYMILGIQSLICVTVVFSMFLDKLKATVILTVAYFFMIGFFSVIHYTNRAVLKKLKTNPNFISEEQAIQEDSESKNN